MCVCMCAQAQLCLLVTPRTVACQVSLSKEFSREEYWSGLLFAFPPARHLSNPEIKPASLASPVLAGEFFTAEPPVGSYCVFAEFRWEKPLHQKNFTSEMRRNENVALFLETSRSRSIIPEEYTHQQHLSLEERSSKVDLECQREIYFHRD